MPNTNRTFKELQDAVKSEMQLDPGLISDLERQTFINNAIADVGGIGLFEKPATLAVVNGLASLPDDLVDIIDVFYDGTPLTPVQRAQKLTGTTPVGYTINYNSIETYPQIATGNIDVYYAYRPAPLVLDTDRPDIPNGFDKMFVDWAVGHAHRKNGNIGLYREYVSAYMETKATLMSELTRRSNSRVTMPYNTEYMATPSTPFDFLL